MCVMIEAHWKKALWLAVALMLSLPVQGGGLSLDKAVKQVRQQTGGRVLSANTVHRGGRVVHRVRVLLPDGRVRTIEIQGR